MDIIVNFKQQGFSILAAGRVKSTVKSYRRIQTKEMKRPLVIITTTGLVILAVVLLTLHLHHESKMEVLSQFQRHQLAHVQHLAYQIEFFFHTRSQELLALSLLVSRENGGFKKRKTDIEAYSKMMEHVKTVSIYNSTGAIVYTTDKNAIGLDHDDREFFSWAKKKGSKGKVFGSCLPQPDSLMFLFAVPLYQNSSNANDPEPGGKFTGVLTVTFDLKGFLAHQLHFSAPEVSLHQVWIMDKDGKLLFQSAHPEMVPRNIFQKDESCNPCHRSFDYVEKILKEKEGTTDYQPRSSSRKIAAFAPIHFENVSWSVVINSPYDEVEVVAKKSLREHLMLLGIVVFALVGGSMLIVRNERLKVRAEEDAKHWREKRALEDEMQQSEALYETIIETAHDAIWVLDAESNLIFLNKRGEEMSGYELWELAGRNVAPLFHPEDLPRVQDLFLKILEDKSYVADLEARLCAKDGEIHLLSMSSGPLYKNARVIGLFSIGKDITDHRKAENALWESEKQLRYLSSQLLTAQETERRRMSKELHDELGGALTALKLRLSFVEKGLKQDQVTVKEECETILQYIDEVIENVRRLSRDLTPSILEDAGLSAAIHWLITNSKKNCKINMTVDVVDIDHLFSQNAQIITYRILQEALTNIGKHAQAKNVSIVVKKYDDGVSFFVEDDGIGFDVLGVSMVNPDERGLGLAIMDERARMLGGSLEIWSEKGKGTRISFHIPLEKGGNA
jgi:PAS domain S-box-containing protein